MTLIGGFDFEATGVDPNEDRIVEVAIKLMELETGAEKLSFRRLINPGCHIPAGSVAIHGITDADVVGAPRFEAVASGFVSLTQKVQVLAAHNGRYYDLPLLRAELKRAGHDVDALALPPLYDTMLEARWATFDGKVPSLGEFCYALDVDYDTSKAHAALYDVTVMLQAIRSGWLTGRIVIPGIPGPGV